MRNPLTCGLTAAALALTLASPSLPAQSEPVATIRLDLDAWNEGFATSNMAACWNDPAVVSWRNTTLTRVLERATTAGVNVNALLAHLEGEMIFTIALDPPAVPGAGPEPALCLGIHQPGQIDALMQDLMASLDAEGQQMLQAVAYREGSDVVVFGTNPNRSQQLAQAITAGRVAAPAAPGACLSAQVDVARILGDVQAADQLPPDAAAGMAAVGLPAVQTVDVTAGFRNRGLATEWNAVFRGPRGGFLSLIGPDRPIGAADLLPANTLIAAAFELAPAEQIFAWIEGMIPADDPLARQNFEAGLAEFQQETGIDVRTQLLPALGQEVALAFGGAMGLSVDAALMLEVRDQATVQRLIDAVITGVNEDLTPPPTAGQPAPGPAIVPTPVTSGNLTYSVIAIPGLPLQVCYAFAGDHLVVTTSQSQMQAVAGAVDGQTLATSAAFQEVAGEAPAQASMLTFANTRALVSTVSQMISPLMMMAGAAADPGTQSLLAQLPSLSQHMGAKVGSLIAQPDRLTLRSYNSSGAEAVVVLMAAITASQAHLAPPPPAGPAQAAPASPAAW